MAQLAGIAFSDIHFFRFKLFNKNDSRLEWSLKALQAIAGIAKSHNVPLFFAGDLFHTPAVVDNKTLNLVIQSYKKYIEIPKIDFYAISGNHDLAEKNGLNHESPSYLQVFYEVFGTFHLLDWYKAPWVDLSGKMAIQGIPYFNSEKELRKQIKAYGKMIKQEAKDFFKILLLHGDCPGAINGSLEIPANDLGSKDDLKELFKPWDQVIMGHIHNPQKITKKILMCGSPIHQISSDTSEMGYWKIFFDSPPKFYGLVNFPKFRKLSKGEEPDNNIDYFIPYEEVVESEEIEAGDFNLNNSRKTLANRYCKKKGIKDPEKKSALITALNEVE
jgi:DNA repair exonuclease SbcCD nuclease subunit